jgi:mannan endo-1,4-beta-mannosidase
MSNLQQVSVRLFASLLLLFFISSLSHAGFSVSGKNLLDANGNNFVMRGVNHPHTWYLGETSSFANIAATGANTIRVVLSTGGRWTRNGGADVANVISMCKVNKLVCVLEVHDSTGFTEQSGATPITDATDYWTSADILPVLQGEEDFVIINIANEPYGNSASVVQYVDGTKGAIEALRVAGLTHTLMIDAANWGQDWQFFMRDNAPAIFAADVNANTVFDVHMYEVFKNSSNQEAYIQAFQAHNLPLVIGEFGPIHSGQDIDEDSILQLANQYGIGYMGWSWSGNGGCCVDLDMVNSFNPNSLKPWGTRLIDGVDGIRQTSVLATVYEGGGGGDTNLAPVAGFSSAAADLVVTFSNSSTDPDGGPQPLSYNWNFGDGQSSTLKDPVHTYATASTYQVTMTANDGEASRAAVNSITVTDGNTPPPGPSNCEYVIQNEWSNGFVGEIRISNNGSTPISGWSVNWAYSDGTTVTSVWNASLSGAYSASNLSYNQNIAPGQTVSFGFQGAHTGDTSVVAVSGSVCN